MTVAEPWRVRAREWLDFPLGRLLDYGCGHGGLVLELAPRIAEGHGVDVRAEAVSSARWHCSTGTFRQIDLDGITPYPDGYFDTVTMLEVLEHVGDERATLAELARILKPGGRLLITTPHQGLLTWLDLGNFKFVAPSLHRFIHCFVLRQSGHYGKRFSATGIVGDIVVGNGRRPWHRHYRLAQVEALLPPTLHIERAASYFPAMRLLMLLKVVVRVASRNRIRPQRLPLESWLEQRQTWLGDQLVVCAKRS
jgi:SAM-dependent methyltransferase